MASCQHPMTASWSQFARQQKLNGSGFMGQQRFANTVKASPNPQNSMGMAF